MSHVRKMRAFWHYGIQPASMIPVEAYGMSFYSQADVQKQGVWSHNITHYLQLLGVRPRPPPGLCPWTPLGASVAQTSWYAITPRHKILDKSLFHIIIQRKLQFCVYICRMKDARMLKVIVFGVMEGKARKGRPCREWTDDITDWCKD